MQPKHRLLVVALVLFALLGQGVRWLAVRSGELALRPFDSAVLAQELDVQNRHCDLVHVNTAGIAELQTLPGIGPVYAERITIARRDQPFTKPKTSCECRALAQTARRSGFDPFLCTRW